MTVSTKTKVMLWGRSAHRCNYPDCGKELIVDEVSADNPTLIGEICHIVADKPDGPRGISTLTNEQRDLYSNLILLCNVHHKIVDDNPEKYSVEWLKLAKERHERWVKESLEGFDSLEQRDREVYASYIDEWTNLIGLGDWLAWSSSVLGADQPAMTISRDQTLQEARTWLLTRIWPKRYSELESAFENFRRVLCDFMEVFHSKSELRHEEMISTSKFYRIPEWNPELYQQLLQKYEFHVDLVSDLMLELTRAGNLTCDRIREFIDSSFRLREGVLLVESGPYMDLSFIRHRVEYRQSERTQMPYPGLRQFAMDRAKRDYYFGQGGIPDELSGEYSTR